MTKILKERRIKRLNESIDILGSRIDYFYDLWKQSGEEEIFYYAMMIKLMKKRNKLSVRLVKILYR